MVVDILDLRHWDCLLLLRDHGDLNLLNHWYVNDFIDVLDLGNNLRHLGDVFLDDWPPPLNDFLDDLRFLNFDGLDLILNSRVHDCVVNLWDLNGLLLDVNFWHLDCFFYNLWFRNFHCDFDGILYDPLLRLHDGNVD